MGIEAGFVVPHPPIMVPEVGKGREKDVQKTMKAYREVAAEIAKIAPETVIISSPHSTVYADYYHISPRKHAQGDFRQFGAKGVSFNIPYDHELAGAIESVMRTQGVSAGTKGEKDPALDHGTMVPLYFLLEASKDLRIIRISPSGFPFPAHYKVGKIIARLLEKQGKKAVWVASGDLSHRLEGSPYGVKEEGKVFDEKIREILDNADFKRLLDFDKGLAKKAGECGLRSFIMMAGALDSRSIEGGLLAYEGPFGIGYAVARYRVKGEDPSRNFDVALYEEEKAKIQTRREKESAPVRLARAALEEMVKKNRRLAKADERRAPLPNKKKPCFVTLKLFGELRGCIGTFSASAATLDEEIVRNAIAAGLEDSRFPPVREEELPYLTYSVDVLEAPESITSEEELDPERYGVIVKKGQRTGLLLPAIEGIDSVDGQLRIALSKAGIDEEEDYSIERFTVTRYR